MLSDSRLKEIYDGTVIHRRPLAGYVKGYHLLPYVLVGPDEKNSRKSVRVKGEIRVGPRLVLTLDGKERTFREIFPDAESFMDAEVVTRTFSFKGPRTRGVEIRSEDLQLDFFEKTGEDLLAAELDEVTRRELIKLAVLWCPRPRFYPVSLERFIVSVLDREFEL